MQQNDLISLLILLGIPLFFLICHRIYRSLKSGGGSLPTIGAGATHVMQDRARKQAIEIVLEQKSTQSSERQSDGTESQK